MAPGDLFDRDPLRDGTGLLKERWQQEGSTHFSVTATFNADNTLKTVTAGKVLYIDTIYINEGSTDTGQMNIRDDTSTLFIHQMTGQQLTATVNLRTPLKFETNLNLNKGGTVDINVTLTGWEEDV